MTSLQEIWTWNGANLASAATAWLLGPSQTRQAWRSPLPCPALDDLEGRGMAEKIIVGCWHPIGRHDAAAIEQQEFPSRYVGRWDLICRYDAAAIEQQEFSLHQHSNATSDDVTSHPFAVGGRV